MMNGFLLNPAVAGSEDYTAINITAREQWLGLKNAPKTGRITYKSFISQIIVTNSERDSYNVLNVAR